MAFALRNVFPADQFPDLATVTETVGPLLSASVSYDGNRELISGDSLARDFDRG